MASRRKSRGKKINPTFYVFCEGQSEEEYVKFLRNKYRIPIEINSKRTGDRISQRHINNYLRTRTTHEKDQIFLMYDLDVDGVLERLSLLDGTLLVSNPCLELWFILHHHDQRANISTANCLQTLTRLCPDYTKGKLSDNLKSILTNHIGDAMDRANHLNSFNNPSTTVTDFIIELNKAQKEKNEN